MSRRSPGRRVPRAADRDLLRSLPRAVAVVGPTAAGKARLGVALAERFGLEVWVCDSVKVYRGLDIGSAKPPPELRERVVHRLIDLVDPDQDFSAGDYARHALDLVRRGGGVFVGGTGFYLRTTVLAPTPMPGAEVPPGDPRRRAFEAWLRAIERAEPGALHRALSAVDPETAAEVHPRNTVRLVRALWLCHAAGGPVSALRAALPPKPRVALLAVLLDPKLAVLDAAIERRLARMRAAGWRAEVEKLHAAGYHRGHKAMNSLGYKQLLDVVEGRRSEDDAFCEIAVRTRQYARRQRTYLRTQLPAELIPVRAPEEVPWQRIEAFLAKGPA